MNVGSTVNNKDNEVFKVKKITTHPKFSSLDYDFAVLELTEEIQFNDVQGAITLATVDPEDGAEANVTGWGETLAVDDKNVLRKATVHIINQDVCKKTFPILTDSMMCAGEPEGGKDRCKSIKDFS